MFELFDTSKNYTFPSGKNVSGTDISSDEAYPFTVFDDCVVDIVGGTINSFHRLSKLCDDFGLDYNDNATALIDVNNYVKNKKIAQKVKIDIMPSLLSVAKITAKSLSDELALTVPDLYPVYEVGYAYKKDDRFTYSGVLYKVNQNHTSQEQWVPGETGTESLYTKIVLNQSGYNVWQQPTGAHDAYNTGDIVEYKGTLYKSLIDGNAWAPDVYPAGWEVYTEE